MKSSNIFLLLAVAAAGCQVGPDYRQPQTALPAAFSQAHKQDGPAAGVPAAPLSAWWTVFNDEALNSLIQEAQSSNHDVKISLARVREARALRGATRSGLLPQVNAGADYRRSRESENSFAGRQIAATGGNAEGDFFSVGPDASWEIDLFGGVRRAVEASDAELQASVESSRDVLVSTLAEIGLSYIDLRGAQKQLAVARDNLRSQEQTLAIARDRFKAGLASELDSVRAEAQVAATRSQIPSIEEAAQRAIHRLSVLIGKAPAELDQQLRAAAPIPAGPPRIPVGLPSDLLRQRPDLRQAERQLAAASARIGVATADLFPKFYLTAAAGLQSVDASDFFSAGSRFWSLGPSIRWPIFNAGRIRQNIKVQNAREEQALLRYEKTVLTSLEEVENSLIAFGKEQERYRELEQAEAANRRAVDLAGDRHRSGLVDFLNVLEAQRSLFSSQAELAASEQSLAQNLVRLYRALGGGWTDRSEETGS